MAVVAFRMPTLDVPKVEILLGDRKFTRHLTYKTISAFSEFYLVKRDRIGQAVKLLIERAL